MREREMDVEGSNAWFDAGRVDLVWYRQYGLVLGGCLASGLSP